jgi:DNA-binding CsgD family transcriptional regulator
MTLERITKQLAGATNLVEVASSICTLSHELYGIYTCIVSIHDADGRPLHAVDNAPEIADEHRRTYFDEIWRQDPLLVFLRVTGNHAIESPDHVTLDPGVGYMDHVVHTRIVPLLCPKGLLGAIKFRHNERISESLANDLTTLGTAASIRLTEMRFTAWPNPVIALLTPRQLDVARCAADGLTNAEIAEFLDLSENTIKKHLKDAFEQLGVANRTELAGVIQHAGPPHDHPAGITHRGTLTITHAPP